MEKFKCIICMENVPLDQCFKTATFRACFNCFCRNCIAKYIQEEISSTNASIRCPLKGACKDHILNPLPCKELISRILFDRWCDNLCELAIRGLERCHCPNKECLELIVDECSGVSDNVENRKITCPNCKKNCCFGCSSPWQVGHRCSRDRDYLPPGNHWQRCPGCGFYVERNGGCRFIYCRCGRVFYHYGGTGCRPRPLFILLLPGLLLLFAFLAFYILLFLAPAWAWTPFVAIFGFVAFLLPNVPE